MRDQDEATAVRYAHEHPDYMLVTWEAAAIPTYAVTADLLLQREKSFPPLDEFLLEAVDAGVKTLEDLQGFLGLEEHVVNYAVTKQILVNNLEFLRSDVGTPAELELTHVGRESLKTLRYVVPTREPYRFTFDRLLWQPIPGRQNDLIRGKQVDEDNLTVLPRAERRRLGTPDIRLSDLGRLLNREQRSGKERIDVMAVAALPRQESRYLRALLLTYASDQGSDLRFEVAVDGVLSSRHTEALSRDGRADSLGKVFENPPTAPTVHGGLQRQCASLSRVRELNRAASNARRHVAPQAAHPDVAVAADTSDEAVILTAAEQLKELHVRALEPFEHRVMLASALRSAKRRLAIVSPTFTKDVFDSSVQTSLAEALQRPDMEVVVALGPQPQAPPEVGDLEALSKLQGLTRAHVNLTVHLLPDVLPPVLIWDDTWIQTTFDWLGHRGPGRGARVDVGVLVTLQEEVDRAYRELLAGLRQA